LFFRGNSENPLERQLLRKSLASNLTLLASSVLHKRNLPKGLFSFFPHHSTFFNSTFFNSTVASFYLSFSIPLSLSSFSFYHRKTKGFVDEAESSGATNGNKEDELFAIGKELSEKQFKREKEIQTQKIKIQPDSILRRFGDDEDGFEAQQQRRDVEHKKVTDLREKVHY
jgi:hypothetical protein